MYNIKTKNNDTDYKSSQLHMDYLVGQHFAAAGAVGLTGYYLTQTTDDQVGGRKAARPDGRRGKALAMARQSSTTTRERVLSVAGTTKPQWTTTVSRATSSFSDWLPLLGLVPLLAGSPASGARR